MPPQVHRENVLQPSQREQLKKARELLIFVQDQFLPSLEIPNRINEVVAEIESLLGY